MYCASMTQQQRRRCSSSKKRLCVNDTTAFLLGPGPVLQVVVVEMAKVKMAVMVKKGGERWKESSKKETVRQ